MRSLEFDLSAFEDLAWWIEQDRAQALRVVRLVREVQREPFSGLGKPEPLKHELSGCWSRRINQEHRLVYQVLPDKIRILS
ncbi:MAG TPA: Txe/YoeB family addiction module toxin [Bryobacteraceae bacterium]|nr:Txe/YoeB family addiction module toxin [Bryobacteraceae bacterium]